MNILTNKINVDEICDNFFLKIEQEKYQDLNQGTPHHYKMKSFLYQHKLSNRIDFDIGYYEIVYGEKTSHNDTVSVSAVYRFGDDVRKRIYSGKLKFTSDKKEFKKKLITSLEKIKEKLKKLELRHSMELGFLKLTSHHFKIEK